MLKHRSDFRSLALHYKFWISFCFSHTFKTHAIIYFHYFIATIKIVEDLPYVHVHLNFLILRE